MNKIQVLIALFFVNVLNINCSHGKDIENDIGIDIQMNKFPKEARTCKNFVASSHSKRKLF